jgi:uncharacterized membrane protein YraQ (UPF0718 family)
MGKIKPYIMFLLIIIVDTIIFFYAPETGEAVYRNTWFNFKEMLSVIPPIFLLLGLLDVWVPRETIIKFLGEKSGIKGIMLSIFMGAAAAGPLYGAFPVAGIMIKKGAKFSNILVFLGAWSTMKIPMFLFELTALGTTFAITRWFVNLAGIIIISFMIDRLIGSDEKLQVYKRHTEGLEL